MMYAIEIEDIHKSFGNNHVLQGVHLRVTAGEVYGLLGPNGAGKSTLIYLMLGFLKPSRGSIRILDTTNIDAVRKHIGYVPEQLRYHLRYTAREYLFFLGTFSDIRHSFLRQRIGEVLLQVGLSDAADRTLATFSTGMLQRVGIAQALLVEPDILLLDEPTSGLDPAFQHDVIDMLSLVRSHGHTVLLCTHQLNVVEHVCDRVGVLTGGKLAVEVDVEQVRDIGANVNIQVNKLPPVMQEQLHQLSPAVHCNEQSILLRPNTQSLQATVLRILLDANVVVLSIESLERPIEHIYLEAVRAASLGMAFSENHLNINRHHNTNTPGTLAEFGVVQIGVTNATNASNGESSILTDTSETVPTAHAVPPNVPATTPMPTDPEKLLRELINAPSMPDMPDDTQQASHSSTSNVVTSPEKHE